MKRTDIPFGEFQMNMIRKIAWSFHHTTGLEFEDLYAEGCLWYCVSLPKYTQSKRKNVVKCSTYVYQEIQFHLLNYARKQHRHAVVYVDQEDPAWTPQYEYYANGIHRDVLRVMRMATDHDTPIPWSHPKVARDALREALREVGWTNQRIRDAIRETKKTINEIDVACII